MNIFVLILGVVVIPAANPPLSHPLTREDSQSLRNARFRCHDAAKSIAQEVERTSTLWNRVWSDDGGLKRLRKELKQLLTIPVNREDLNNSPKEMGRLTGWLDGSKRLRKELKNNGDWSSPLGFTEWYVGKFREVLSWIAVLLKSNDRINDAGDALNYEVAYTEALMVSLKPPGDIKYTLSKKVFALLGRMYLLLKKPHPNPFAEIVWGKGNWDSIPFRIVTAGTDLKLVGPSVSRLWGKIKPETEKTLRGIFDKLNGIELSDGEDETTLAAIKAEINRLLKMMPTN